MAARIAINGYGRIGQCVLRALFERGLESKLQPVAINELADLETVSYLTRYDTTHGRFPKPVSIEGDSLKIADQRIKVLKAESPEQLPWGELGVDLLLECSGSFSDRATAQRHLDQGAARLLFSQPATADVDTTVVFGLNTDSINVNHKVVSAASCTTNCVIPILSTINKVFGIEQGVTTTIHSAMNDQPVIDAYHRTDLRLTRSALQSIIPVDTGLAKGVDRLLPELAGRFECLHLRVPTINVSLMDMSIQLSRDTSVEEVNQLFKELAEGDLKGLLGFTEEPHASVDFNGDSRSVVVDGTQTRLSGKRLLKLICWFDNEWGFANRMLDIAEHWLALEKQ
ncbi:MAG: hypothetical protein RL143_1301 [Pseudomonadota bacterium]